MSSEPIEIQEACDQPERRFGAYGVAWRDIGGVILGAFIFGFAAWGAALAGLVGLPLVVIFGGVAVWNLVCVPMMLADRRRLRRG